MSYLVENKIEEAVAKGTETILITVAITVGIVLVSTFSQIYYKIRRYNKIKKKIYTKFVKICLRNIDNEINT